MIKNNEYQYGSVAKFFHWLIALLIIAMFIMGFTMTNIPKSSLRSTLYDMHKATGLVVFVLACIRLSWRFINIQPTLHFIPTILRYMAHSNIFFLYVLMFAMPISGFLISTLGGHEVSFYYLFTINPFVTDPAASHLFSTTHELLGYLLIGVFVLHVMGALYHQFIRKDDVLKRIWIKNS